MTNTYIKLKQNHNVFKMMLSHLILLICAYKFEEAQLYLNECYRYNEFIISDECMVGRNILFLLKDDIINIDECKKKIKDIITKYPIIYLNKEIITLLKNINIDHVYKIQQDKIRQFVENELENIL
jgi:hypothetical protein